LAACIKNSFRRKLRYQDIVETVAVNCGVGQNCSGHCKSIKTLKPYLNLKKSKAYFENNL
jgi:hypothetical protein